MNKRYFWIYVLPILMVTTIIGFGVLGVKSAVYEQKMQTELAKIEWKMDAVEIYDENRPYYDKATDIIEVIWYDMENHWVGKRFFSSNPIELTWEDVDEREKRLNLMDAVYLSETYSPEQTLDGKEILIDQNGKQVGTTEMQAIYDWSDEYIFGRLDEKTGAILNRQNQVVMQSSEYDFNHLDKNLCWKRPLYGKADTSAVFNIKTGQTIYEIEGDWSFSCNALGYEAWDSESDIKVYFDYDFHEISRIEQGMIHIGYTANPVYWQVDAEGRKAIVNENLQCKKEYGKELLAFSDFDDNLALLYFRDKLLCVDENVNIVFEKKTRIRDYYADDSYDEKNSIVEGLNVDGFVDGLAVFTLDGYRYGVLDCEGNILLDPVFKGKNSLTVMKNQHVAVFYEGEFCIGKIKTASGGMKNE